MESTSRFRTVKVSNPKFERDNLRYITLKTNNLRGRGNICVFVPSNVSATDLPISILLHGVYGSANSWSQQAGAHQTALRLIKKGTIRPMILAMPSDGLWGDGSAYLPHNGYDFEKWIVEDVVGAVKMNIPQAADSKHLFIGGLSMGGFGALRLGAKYGKLFNAISSHSAITALPQMELFVEEPLQEYRQDDETSESVFLTIKKNWKTLPPLRFDCGQTDLLIEHNRTLHQQLTEENIPHIYEEFEGAHEWIYWETHLEDTLRFFEKHCFDGG
ncbi:MAG: alpha/beta hydrolase-fold protein [Bacteroidota bacterium]